MGTTGTATRTLATRTLINHAADTPMTLACWHPKRSPGREDHLLAVWLLICNCQLYRHHPTAWQHMYVRISQTLSDIVVRVDRRPPERTDA